MPRPGRRTGMDKTGIRDAASVIVLRHDGDRPARVLMGRRGAGAAFMPSKFVFPGGALDAADSAVPLADLPDSACLDRLRMQADPALAEPLLKAAIRELWEETGLRLGRAAPRARDLARQVPAAWRGFLDRGILPSAAGLRFVFRAITPPGRTRRFDARFFLVDAARLDGDLDGFSEASDELSDLQWIPLERTRDFDLPFITRVILAEIAETLTEPARDHHVPFFYNEAGVSHFSLL